MAVRVLVKFGKSGKKGRIAYIQPLSDIAKALGMPVIDPEKAPDGVIGHRDGRSITCKLTDITNVGGRNQKTVSFPVPDDAKKSQITAFCKKYGKISRWSGAGERGAGIKDSNISGSSGSDGNGIVNAVGELANLAGDLVDLADIDGPVDLVDDLIQTYQSAKDLLDFNN